MEIVFENRATLSENYRDSNTVEDFYGCLNIAAAAGRDDSVAWALNQGFPINHLAANNDFHAVDLVPVVGVVAHAFDERQFTPLREAIKNHKNEVVELLVEKGAATRYRVPGFSDFSAIHDAVEFKNYEALRILLRVGTSANVLKGKSAPTPLLLAIKSGDLEAIKILLEYGAFVNYSGGLKQPLAAATLVGNQNIIDYLFANGARVEISPKAKSRNSNETLGPGSTGESEVGEFFGLIGKLVVMAGVFVLMAEGAKDNSSVSYGDYQKFESEFHTGRRSGALISSKYCSSDFDCSYGQACAKAPYSSVGMCMAAVGSYGAPSVNGPSMDSIGVRTGEMCVGAGDCPAGFRCDFDLKMCVK